MLYNCSCLKVVCILLIHCLIISCASDKQQNTEKDISKQEETNYTEYTDSITANLEPPPAEKIPENYQPKNVETKKTTENSVEDIKPDTKIASKKTSKGSDPKTLNKRAKITFDKPTYDFGEISAGDIIDHKFTFTNTGNSALEIKEARPSCGCTAPSYPFIQIEPGEKGYIGVQYNSVGKYGSQIADITIFSNADPKEVKIFLKGIVNEKFQKSKVDSLEGL